MLELLDLEELLVDQLESDPSVLRRYMESIAEKD